MARIALIVAVALLAVACTAARDVAPSTTASVTTSPVTTSPVTTSPVTQGPLAVPAELAGFTTASIAVGDRELTVAVAASPAERRQGLMFVTDLGDLEGMVFTFDAEGRRTFWMKDTVLALDIAFFDRSGRFVDRLTMDPCDLGDACPSYLASGPFQYAVEVPAGGFNWLTGEEVMGFTE